MAAGGCGGRVADEIADESAQSLRLCREPPILGKAQGAADSRHRPKHITWPNWASVRSGFSPVDIWRESREAFVATRQRGIVNAARDNLDELWRMRRGGDGYGVHGQMAARLVGAGPGIAAVQVWKASIDASP